MTDEPTRENAAENPCEGLEASLAALGRVLEDLGKKVSTDGGPWFRVIRIDDGSSR